MGTPVLPLPGQPQPLKDGEFVSQSHAPKVMFITDDVAPPSRVYINRDDQLAVQVIDLNQAPHVQITIRLLTADGTIVPIQREFIGFPGLGPSTTLIQLAEGFLLSVAIVAFATPQRGTTFVRAWINRGPASPLNAAELLISDYCTTAQIAGWPDGSIKYPTEGPGQLFSSNASNPAVGAEWVSQQVQNSSRWRLVCGSATFTTSATVAARAPAICIRDGALNTLWVGVAGATVPASTAVRINFASSATPGALVGNQLQVTLPDPCILPLGFTFGSLTQNLQAGDSYTGIQFLLEQWVDQV